MGLYWGIANSAVVDAIARLSSHHLISWKLAIKALSVIRDKGDNQSATKLLDKTLSGARQREHAFPKGLTQEAMKGCWPNEPSNLVGTNLAANWDPPMFIDQDCRETIANH